MIRKKKIVLLVCLPAIPAVILMLLLLMFESSAHAVESSASSPPAVRLPITGEYTVTSNHGFRHDPISGIDQLHAGIDLAGPPGATIVAPIPGTVTATPLSTTGGNMVIIDHGGGVESRYLHLATTTVSPGRNVAAGDPLGTQGSTGNATGSHLHWEIRSAGSVLDPRTWAKTQGLTIPPEGAHGYAPAAGRPIPATESPKDGLSNSSTVARETPPHPVSPRKIDMYQKEQIHNAALIIKSGQELNLDTWTLTVGVMTAMGESSLINIDYGDAVGPDSRGLFQQRANGAWGTLEDRMNPEIAAKNFFTALLRVPGYRDLTPTIAAHRTQSNADPNHYERFWGQATLMVSTLINQSSSLATNLPVTGSKNFPELTGLTPPKPIPVLRVSPPVVPLPPCGKDDLSSISLGHPVRFREEEVTHHNGT